MSGALFLIPVSIVMGMIGLAAFLWSLRHNQFEDLDGDAGRILTAPDQPINFVNKEKTNGKLASKSHHTVPDRGV